MTPLTHFCLTLRRPPTHPTSFFTRALLHITFNTNTDYVLFTFYVLFVRLCFVVSRKLLPVSWPCLSACLSSSFGGVGVLRVFWCWKLLWKLWKTILHIWILTVECWSHWQVFCFWRRVVVLFYAMCRLWQYMSFPLVMTGCKELIFKKQFFNF